MSSFSEQNHTAVGFIDKTILNKRLILSDYVTIWLSDIRVKLK